MLTQSLEYLEKVSRWKFAFALLNTDHITDLNSEQRKRLAIGVELAAKPTTLLLLDQALSGNKY